MAFLDDARRDFAAIEVPITWIHGRYDAWMDLERIRHALSYGSTGNRKIVEVPTGHQLKTSQEALATFQLIAREVSRMALGHELTPRLPDLVTLGRQRDAERKRLPRANVDVQEFWRRYLVGAGENLGMELLTATSTYRRFVGEHVEAMGLRGGERVVDLGSGTGSISRHVATCSDRPGDLELVEVDYVHEGLCRARARLRDLGSPTGLRVHHVECDLDPAGARGGIALGTGSADVVVASLLLNYLRSPEALLREAHRLLRPGGRLVLSSLKRDADISKICVEGVKELRSGLARDAFGPAGERVLDDSIRTFMSDAARLLDLEELGLFRFWDPEELGRMVSGAGFRGVELQPGLGDPPQAITLTAQRP